MKRGGNKMFAPVRRINVRPLTLKVWDDDWFDNFFAKTENDNGGFLPSVDVSEGEKSFTVAAELPGMDPKEIDLTMERDVLTISGEMKDENEEKEGEYYRRETSYGSFCRSIRLPSEVDDKKIKADYKDGILKVTLPKSNGKSKKVIKVEAHKEN